jgi:PKD repeat protein
VKTQRRFVITGRFKRHKILGICLILVAALTLSATTALAQEPQRVFQVDPGTPGQPANDLTWTYESGPELDVIDVVFTDGKTCQLGATTHLIGLYFSRPSAAYTGQLLDAAGNLIPDALLAGEVPGTGDFASAGVLDLSTQGGPTVFSGIRFASSLVPSFYEFKWFSGACTVGEGEGTGDQPPVAEAGSPVNGTAGVAVTFDGSGSFDPDGNIEQYDWDFGDGSDPLINVGPAPSHTYETSSTYNVILTVTDNDGLTNSDTVTATIGESSTPPTADAGGPYKGTAGVEVVFDGTASSDPGGSPLQYDWDFGDGSDPLINAGPRPSHTYATSDTYNVILTVTDNDGETDSDTTTATIAVANQPPAADAGQPVVGTIGQAVTFDGSLSFDQDGTIVKYDWYFGDGNIALDAGPTPSHTYQAAGLHSVSLTVTDDGGLPDSDSTTALIGEFSQPPTADANGPYNGRVGVAVSFDGSGSGDPDGSPLQYDWYFGDDTVALNAGEMPTHVYDAPGKYIAKLTVTDESGETDTDITVVTIGIGNLPPRADAGDSVSGKAGRRITLDGTGSRDTDGIVVRYAWEFGDGETGTGRTPTHRYDEPGIYFVTLTVTDSDGATNSDRTLAVISSRFECVEECRADKDECLDAARADRETCIESCDGFWCRRACRKEFRSARDLCRAEFLVCRADCR